jgi:hypothetical protein
MRPRSNNAHKSSECFSYVNVTFQSQFHNVAIKCVLGQDSIMFN